MGDRASGAGALLPLELQLDLVDDVQRVQDARKQLLSAERALATDLAWARALHGVSVAQLARITGVSQRGVRQLLRTSVL